jgi:hypothetical protein
MARGYAVLPLDPLKPLLFDFKLALKPVLALIG